MRGMNAFSRKDAIGSLESYSAVIVLHLALITFFPDNRAHQHWNAELDGFRKILHRFDKAKKKSRHNYNEQLITDVLNEEFLDHHDKDILATALEAKGLPIDVDSVDWKSLESAAENFAKSIM